MNNNLQQPPSANLNKTYVQNYYPSTLLDEKPQNNTANTKANIDATPQNNNESQFLNQNNPLQNLLNGFSTNNNQNNILSLLLQNLNSSNSSASNILSLINNFNSNNSKNIASILSTISSNKMHSTDKKSTNKFEEESKIDKFVNINDYDL